MSIISKRLAALERNAGDQRPLLIWEGGQIPDNPDNRPVITVRWAKSAVEATPDPSGCSNARQTSGADRHTDSLGATDAPLIEGG